MLHLVEATVHVIRVLRLLLPRVGARQEMVSAVVSIGHGAVFRIGGACQIGTRPLEAAGLGGSSPRHGNLRQLVLAVVRIARYDGTTSRAGGVRLGDRD